MKALLKNPRIVLWLFLILFSLASISFIGIQFGVDFKGGSLFQIHLEEKPTAQQLSTITSIVQKRIDAFGLKDTRVTPFGEQFVLAQIAQTDPAEIERIELLLKTQGKFEATLDENVLFSGSEIIQIVRDPARGYGIRQESPASFVWDLPFTLNESSAQRFSRLVFHKCTLLSFTETQQGVYDCKETYFFIDRPTNAVLLIPKDVFEKDTALLLAGSSEADIQQGTLMSELLANANLSYLVTDGDLNESQLNQIKALSKTIAIVHESMSESSRNALESLGLIVREFHASENEPWTWKATGARTTVRLSESITGTDPYIDRIDDAKIFYDLGITGRAESFQEAQARLQELTILLETGSLPIPIDEISKETISPFLGKEFLDGVLLIALAAILTVTVILYLRYRMLKIVLPISITAISEIIIILGFSSFFKFNLDLAAVTGILAVIGTGVDHQIIITDELLKADEVTSGSLSSRSKRAFFMIMAIAATIIAVMLPLVFFDFGLGKLVGFALTTILGVIIGTTITRPAYSEIAKHVLEQKAKN